MIPIRCFSCGKPVGHLWEDYEKETKKGTKTDTIFKKMGLDRYCCRRMLLSHRDYIDQVIAYDVKS
ncbi:MAG: DNA-directed RNA polymerase subunit N [DPANN group archaeon]|nr:DNA-directed RNA polymerase subunit N [DPANN group archaeon]